MQLLPVDARVELGLNGPLSVQVSRLMEAVRQRHGGDGEKGGGRKGRREERRKRGNGERGSTNRSTKTELPVRKMSVDVEVVRQMFISRWGGGGGGGYVYESHVYLFCSSDSFFFSAFVTKRRRRRMRQEPIVGEITRKTEKS